MKNKIIIITAPSGSGKTSIARYLLERFPSLEFSISATTRAPRGSEVDGCEYYFLTTEDFEKKINEGAFLEWEMVYQGKYYGTLKSEIDRIWQANRVPLLDIDVQGAMRVQKMFPGSCYSLFIEAPSETELRKRLEKRRTETSESIEVRINKAAHEKRFKEFFDAVIVNNLLEKAQKEAGEKIETFFG
jgi:guanylate kinase